MLIESSCRASLIVIRSVAEVMRPREVGRVGSWRGDSL